LAPAQALQQARESALAQARELEQARGWALAQARKSSRRRAALVTQAPAAARRPGRRLARCSAQGAFAASAPDAALKRLPAACRALAAAIAGRAQAGFCAAARADRTPP
jgi:hypothetical protein